MIEKMPQQPDGQIPQSVLRDWEEVLTNLTIIKASDELRQETFKMFKKGELGPRPNGNDHEKQHAWERKARRLATRAAENVDLTHELSGE